MSIMKKQRQKQNYFKIPNHVFYLLTHYLLDYSLIILWHPSQFACQSLPWKYITSNTTSILIIQLRLDYLSSKLNKKPITLDHL